MGSIVKPCTIAKHAATDLLYPWEKAKDSKSNATTDSNSAPSRELCWTKPAAGCFKCNVDAAIFEGETSTESVCVCVMIRCF